MPLDRWDLVAPSASFFLWFILMMAGGRPKAMTNAVVESLLIAIGCFIIVVYRPRLKFKKQNFIFGAMLVAPIVWLSTPAFSHSDALGAYLYVWRHENIKPDVRSSILKGIVVCGMTPDEAAVAGGTYIWMSENGKLKRMTFNNLSQFSTDRPVGFCAYFENEAVTNIERLPDEPNR